MVSVYMPSIILRLHRKQHHQNAQCQNQIIIPVQSTIVFSQINILIKNALFNSPKFDYAHSIVANKRIVGGAKVQ